MTVYLDVIFFINLLYQFGILEVLTMLYKIKVSTIRLLSGAVLGSLLYCLCIVLQLPLGELWYKIVLGIGIGIVVNIVAFVPMALHRMWILLMSQCLLAFCLSGILQFLPVNVQTGYLMLTASGAVIFLCLFCVRIRKMLFEKIRNEQSIYRAHIVHRGKLVEVNALMDTGNSLTDPISGEVVIVMQKTTMEKLFKEDELRQQPGYRMIPYHSIGKNDGILEAFRLERLEIVGKKTRDDSNMLFLNLICAVHKHDYKSGTYEVILHPLMFS